MSLRDHLPAHETIAEFEVARFDRFEDGLLLGEHGRRLGGIYLMGYFAEMSLKSAFFQLLGFRADEPITMKDVKTAGVLACQDLRVREAPERYHGLIFWFQAILALRDHLGQSLSTDLSRELGWRIQRIAANWRVSMRYSRDVTVPKDWSDFVFDMRWIRDNCDSLAMISLGRWQGG